MKKELLNIIDEVVNNKDKYSQYYVAKFGINQSNFSKIRNGERSINNITLDTILKMIDVYNSKQ